MEEKAIDYQLYYGVDPELASALSPPCTLNRENCTKKAEIVNEICNCAYCKTCINE